MTTFRTIRIQPVCLSVFLGLLGAGAAAADENLVDNPDFDSDVSAWELTEDSAPGTLSWAPDDASGAPDSGSLEIAGGPVQDDVEVGHCLDSLEPGSVLEAEAEVRFLEGGGSDHLIFIPVLYFTSPDCSGANIGSAGSPSSSSLLAWSSLSRPDIQLPETARSARIELTVRPKTEDAGAFVAQVDDVIVRGEASDGGDPDGPPEPDPDGWFTDPTFPGFRFNVEITAGESSRLGVREPFCLDETVCVSGAVPGRVEIQIRIVGPKPNGRLWPTLFKASTSRFDVWIEQLSTGVVKHYVLEGAAPGSSELPGLFDRDGFVP